MARTGSSVMNETGLLGRLLPDWARIVGQMQFDTYHVFTVDEHTIEAVRVLNTLERGDLDRGGTGRLRPGRPPAIAPGAVHVAMLLHDIAKGRGGDHSVLGAEAGAEPCRPRSSA